MTESFNLQSYLSNYKQTNYDPTKKDAAAKANMEAQEQAMVEEAVKNQATFLSVTLGEKMAEMGIGQRVVQQLADTAAHVVTGAFSNFDKWLEENEHIFDERLYNAEIQGFAKQMFFASQAMGQDAAENQVGQKFQYNM